MKVLLKIVGYSVLFLSTFLIFLMITFPFEVLKETVSVELTKQLNMAVRIGNLSPVFPFGFQAGNVSMVTDTGQELRVKKMAARVKILPLFTGSAGATISLSATGKDSLEIDGSLGIVDAIGGNPIPNRVKLKSRKFPIGPFADFAVAKVVSGMMKGKGSQNAMNMMLAPFLEKVRFSAELHSDIDLKLDPSNIPSSKGSLLIDLKKARLAVEDPTMPIPEQNFKNAKIAGKIKGGSFLLSDSSGLESKDLELGISGTVALKQPPGRSALDMALSFELKDALKEQLGFVMDLVAPESDGKISKKIVGTVSQPSFLN